MNGPARAPLALGLEMVFNLLAGDAPDRYFQANETRHRLNFRGEIISPNLVLVDEWQRVQISLGGDPPPVWWVVPIETISQSEAGFERVYQGSAILAVWKNEEQVSKNAGIPLDPFARPALKNAALGATLPAPTCSLFLRGAFARFSLGGE
jgi:hypothetical protein